MKRIILIFSFITAIANASTDVDCLRTRLKIFIAQYEALNDNYHGLIIDSTCTDNTQNKFTFSDDHTYLWTSYARLSPNSKFEKRDPEKLSYKAKISQEGDFKIYNRDPETYRVFHTEDSVYVEKKYKSSSEITEKIWHIKNDTLYEVTVKSDTTDSDGSRTPQSISTMIMTYDPGFKNRCYETYLNGGKYEVLYEYESRGDTLIEYYGALVGNVGFPTAHSKETDSVWSRTFYVPFNVEPTLGIVCKPHPGNTPKEAKTFDLLGRPARNEHLIRVMK